jgi:hypothetical protein
MGGACHRTDECRHRRPGCRGRPRPMGAGGGPTARRTRERRGGRRGSDRTERRRRHRSVVRHLPARPAPAARTTAASVVAHRAVVALRAARHASKSASTAAYLTSSPRSCRAISAARNSCAASDSATGVITAKPDMSRKYRASVPATASVSSSAAAASEAASARSASEGSTSRLSASGARSAVAGRDAEVSTSADSAALERAWLRFIDMGAFPSDPGSTPGEVIAAGFNAGITDRAASRDGAVGASGAPTV